MSCRSGRHDQQDAVLALGDGLDSGVDGVALVVPRGLPAAVVEVVVQDDPLGGGSQSLHRSRGEGNASRARLVSGAALAPVRSGKTNPSPFEEKANGMFSVPA